MYYITNIVIYNKSNAEVKIYHFIIYLCISICYIAYLNRYLIYNIKYLFEYTYN